MKTHAMTTLVLLVASAALTGCSKDEKRTTVPTGPSTSVSTLRVTTEWAGDHPDPDGYAIAIDGESRGPIGLNESRTIQVPAGEYDITLDGVAATCEVEDGTVRSVIATEGATIDVHFSVKNLGAIRNRIFIQNFENGRRSFYLLHSDGSGAARFPIPFDVIDCTVSGDGRWVAFSAQAGGLWVMRANGSDLVQISDEGREPAWRSGGSMQIAFVKSNGIMDDIWAINHDGEGLTNLTNTPDVDEHSPAWSPSGLSFAYERRTLSDDETSVMNVQIYVAQFNGSFPRDLIDGPAGGGEGEYELHPVWSPDGRKIAYASTRRHPGENGDGRGDLEIHVVNVDGTNDRFLTDDDLRNTGPSWSNDGLQIVYTTERETGGSSHVYLMNANGTGQRVIEGVPAGSNQTFTRSWVH